MNNPFGIRCQSKKIFLFFRVNALTRASSTACWWCDKVDFQWPLEFDKLFARFLFARFGITKTDKTKTLSAALHR
jgi:hypothetical protein